MEAITSLMPFTEADHDADHAVMKLDKLMELFELDFMMRGTADAVSTLLSEQLARHLGRRVRHVRVTRARRRLGQYAKPRPLRTGFIQGLYRQHHRRTDKSVQVRADFEAEGMGRGAVTVTLEAISEADQRSLDEGNFGDQKMETVVEEMTSSSDEEAANDIDKIRWVRLFRCSRPDMCFSFRPRNKIPLDDARRVQRYTHAQLQAEYTARFWEAYEATLKSPVRVGEVQVLSPKLMEGINPSRMDVPFSVILSPDAILDESIIKSMVWQAAAHVRRFCSFPFWFKGRKPFDILGIFVSPLYGNPMTYAPGDEPDHRGDQFRLLSDYTELTEESTALREELLRGHAPFKLTLLCHGKQQEKHTCGYIVKPFNPTARAETRMYRLCKVDLGRNIIQAENVWNIQSAQEVLQELREVTSSDGFIPGMKVTRVEQRTLQIIDLALHEGQRLTQICVAQSMRDVGLHVWESGDIVAHTSAHLLLITAPLSSLAARAEQLKMRVRVNPRPGREDFQGGFTKYNFIRGGPMQRYRVGTKNLPHPYDNYYADFTPVQRLQLVMDYITRPRVIDANASAAEVRSSGAGMNPHELLAEGILADFAPMHIDFRVQRFKIYWAKMTLKAAREQQEADRKYHSKMVALASPSMQRAAEQAALASQRSAARRQAPLKVVVTSPASPTPAQQGRYVDTGPPSARGYEDKLAPIDAHTAYHGTPLSPGAEAAPDKITSHAMNSDAIGGAFSIAQALNSGAGGGDMAGSYFNDDVGIVMQPLANNGTVQRWRRAWASCCCRCCHAGRDKGRCGGCGAFWARALELTVGQLDQPLDSVATYFSVTVGFYFYWAQFYTTQVFIPAMLGLLVAILQGTIDTEAEPIGGVKTEHLIVFIYSTLVMLWGTLCLEWFLQREAQMSYKWDVKKVAESEPLRPEFIMAMHRRDDENHEQDSFLAELFALVQLSSHKRRNMQRQLRRDLEVYNELYVFPQNMRRRAFWLSIVVAAVGVIIVAATTVAVLVVPPIIFGDASVFGVRWDSIASGVAQGVIIPLLNWLFRWFAVRLTNREHHRHESAHVNSLIVKLFAFQFVNSYGTLFYIGFWLTDLSKLGSQLAGILITGQVIRILREHVLMRVLNNIKLRNYEKQQNETFTRSVATEHERQQAGMDDVELFDTGALHFSSARLNMVRRAILELAKPSAPNLIDEYLHFVIQFGFVSMFCAAFPLAGLTAFVTNMFEIRFDAEKFLLSRRPLPHGSAGIGVWFPIMQFLSVLAVLTNTSIIYLSTTSTHPETGEVTSSLEQILPSLGKVGPLMGAVLMEHILMAVKWLVRVVTPDTPDSILDDAFREKYFLLKVDRTMRNECAVNTQVLSASGALGESEAIFESKRLGGDSDTSSSSDDDATSRSKRGFLSMFKRKKKRQRNQERR